MGESYNGLTEEEFDAMYPNGVPDKKNGAEKNLDNDPQTNDVGDGDRHAPADFENDSGHVDETIQPGESAESEPVQQTEEDQDVDERGVSWKNRAKEYERKLREIEAQTQVVPEPPPVESPPELPPSLQQQQPGIQGSQQPTLPTDWDGVPGYLEQMGKTIEQRAEQKAERRAMQVVQQQQTEQRVLSDYPDMMNPQSLLFQWTQYELNTRYSNDSRFVEEATMRAAARCKIQAKSTQTGQTTLTQPQPKALPRTPVQPPNTERGTFQRKQGKVKLSEESLKAAKAFGQNPKDIEAMARKQKYAFITGEDLFINED